MRARSSSLSSLLVLPLVNGLVMQRTVTGSTDRCAAIDVEENQVSLTYPDLYIGDSHTCVCRSSLDQFVVDNFLSVPSHEKIVSGLQSVTDAEYKLCYYPSLARPSCTYDIPCAFTCPEGYHADLKTRTCVCDGQTCEKNESQVALKFKDTFSGVARRLRKEI